MDWFGPEKRIEITEQADGLIVRATGVTKSLLRLLPMIVVGLLSYFAWRNRSWVFLLFVIIFGFVALRKIFRNENVEIRVNEDGLEVRSYLDEPIEDGVRVRWRDISGLDYRVGGEDEPSGLYARTGRWNGRCLIEGLNSEQSEQIYCSHFQALSLHRNG